MKKVVFFTTSLNSGGIENYLLRFLKYSEDEIKPYIFCKSGEFGELECKYKKIKNIELKQLEIGYFNFLSLIRLYFFLKKNQIETICDFTGNFAGLIIFVAKCSGIKKRIAFYRGSSNHFNETYFRLKYNGFMKWLVKKFATKILSNSKSALNFFYNDNYFLDNRFKVIYNGINADCFSIFSNKNDLRKEFRLPINAFIVGHTGRYNKAKNHLTLAKVANKLCEKYQNLLFVVCGKNTEKLKEETASIFPILADRMIALGYQSEINKILKTFDLFFFPSSSEGQPNALIEAMISGLPIVASDIPSIKETTPPQIHPALKDPFDTEGFIREIEKIYLNPDYRNSLIFSEWAKHEFNPSILFREFYNEL